MISLRIGGPRDARTGEVRHTAKYQGHFNEKSLGGLEGTWERVMNAALENMIRDPAGRPPARFTGVNIRYPHPP